MLLDEVLEYLRPCRMSATLVDVTLGDAGHASAMLARYAEIELSGSDADKAMIERAAVTLAPYRGRCRIRHAWADDALAALRPASVETVLMDLGMARFHFEGSGRGFSFMRDEPLDMRLDRTAIRTARDVLNQTGQDDLASVLLRGGDRRAYQHARAIVQARGDRPIETTFDLARAVMTVSPWHGGQRHPATLVFQAVRVAVNGELERLERAVLLAWRALTRGGRLAVIAFHSLEDGIVKRFARATVDAVELTKSPLTPDATEVRANPAARSARLRVLERRP